MIETLLNTLRRAGNICAKFTPFRAITPRPFRGRSRGGLWPRKGKHVKHLSDQLARDIGLSPTDMARHRHVWPSQSVDRPRL